MKTINGVPTEEEEFFRQNTGLIWMVVNRFQAQTNVLGIDREDLFSEGSIGFIKAYRYFDDSRGNQFSTYAVRMIGGYIQRYLRDKTRMIKFARSTYDLAARIRKEKCEHLTAEEISEKLDVSIESVHAAIASKIPPESLSKEIQTESEKITYLDLIGTESDFTGSSVGDFLSRLQDKERGIITLRMQGYKQQEIGQAMQMSQVHVSRTLKKISKKYEAYQGTAV